MINFRTIKQLVREISLFQDNVEQAFKQVNDQPFIGGKLIEVVRGSTGNVIIQTGFNRKPKGYVLCNSYETISVERVSMSDEQEARGLITLNIDTAGTYLFWVF